MITTKKGLSQLDPKIASLPDLGIVGKRSAVKPTPFTEVIEPALMSVEKKKEKIPCRPPPTGISHTPPPYLSQLVTLGPPTAALAPVTAFVSWRHPCPCAPLPLTPSLREREAPYLVSPPCLAPWLPYVGRRCTAAPSCPHPPHTPPLLLLRRSSTTPCCALPRSLPPPLLAPLTLFATCER